MMDKFMNGLWRVWVVLFIHEAQWNEGLVCGTNNVMEGPVLDFCSGGQINDRTHLYLSNSKLPQSGSSECKCIMSVRTSGSGAGQVTMYAYFVGQFPRQPDINVTFSNGSGWIDYSQNFTEFTVRAAGHYPFIYKTMPSFRGAEICINITVATSGPMFTVRCLKSQSSVIIESTRSSIVPVTPPSGPPDTESDPVVVNHVLIAVVCVGVVVLAVVFGVVSYFKKRRAISLKDEDASEDEVIENPMYNVDIEESTFKPNHNCTQIQRQQKKSRSRPCYKDLTYKGKMAIQDESLVNSYDYIDDSCMKGNRARAAGVVNNDMSIQMSAYDHGVCDNVSTTHGVSNVTYYGEQKEGNDDPYVVISDSDKYCYAEISDNQPNTADAGVAHSRDKESKLDANEKKPKQITTPVSKMNNQENVYNHTTDRAHILAMHEYSHLGKVAKLNTNPLNMYDTAKVISKTKLEDGD